MSPYEKSALNEKVYSRRCRWQDFFDSERHFFEAMHEIEISSCLDIGGATGGFGAAWRRKYETDFDYTCIDVDANCISNGKKQNPSFKFVHDHFPSAQLDGKSYDLVIMLSLFCQFEDWKNTLRAMFERSHRFVNFSCVLRTDGTTVVDDEISYFYCLDTEERMPQVIHNLYEIRNYLCLKELGAKSIRFYGYHTPSTGTNYRCVPNSGQIKGNFMIEKYQPEELEQVRYFGGQEIHDFLKVGHAFISPHEIEFIIDGERFDHR